MIVWSILCLQASKPPKVQIIYCLAGTKTRGILKNPLTFILQKLRSLRIHILSSHSRLGTAASLLTDPYSSPTPYMKIHYVRHPLCGRGVGGWGVVASVTGRTDVPSFVQGHSVHSVLDIRNHLLNQGTKTSDLASYPKFPFFNIASVRID
jgi:hypothetical protein